LEVEVGADGVVRQPGRTNFAGSSCTPMAGVFRAAAMLGAPWEEAWHRFSTVPAGILGLPNRLEVGAPADFYILRWKEGVTNPGALPDWQTVLGGVAGAPHTATLT
jgi:N-acetylglucosamine-6-phosphate deacetylase